jgi:hypothetical protein
VTAQATHADNAWTLPDERLRIGGYLRKNLRNTDAFKCIVGRKFG